MFYVTRTKEAMEDSVDFLRQIFDLLNDGGVFDVHSDEQKAIVDFKHPEELKVRFIFKLITYVGWGTSK